MNLQQLKIIGIDLYQDWFDAHYTILEYRSPFHHPAWMETVARSLNFKTVYVGIFEKNELISVIPGFLYQRGLMRLFGSPLRGTMTSYLGATSLKPISTIQEQMDLLTACNTFLSKKLGVAYSRFTLRNEPPKRPNLTANWDDKSSGSYRLDLTSGVEELWKNLKSDCRRNIRRAREAGIEIAPLEDAGLFYNMIKATFSRHGSTSFHKEKFFQELLNELIPRDLLWAWGAKYEGQTIAGALFLHDDQEIHFISGASLPQFGSLPTSYLLHWKAIETGTELGLRIFNSERSRIPSIDKFKESFRPVLEKRYTLINAPGYLRLAQKVYIKVYSRLRNLNSRFQREKKDPQLST